VTPRSQNKIVTCEIFFYKRVVYTHERSMCFLHDSNSIVSANKFITKR
jgi:hypothetical protein